MLPHGLLFWRSLTQWIGGLGIVFFTIALLPSLVGGQTKVFAAEATGPIKTKLHPRLSTSAKWIWSIYLMLTIACIASYYVAGMSLFDSFNYAMTTTATGGFSTHNSSTSFSIRRHWNTSVPSSASCRVLISPCSMQPSSSSRSRICSRIQSLSSICSSLQPSRLSSW